MTAEFAHKSVLLKECIDGLNIKSDGTYVDGTLGGAGHSSEILKRLGKKGLLVGIDQDAEAIAVASKRLEEVETEGSFKVVKTNFVNLIEACKECDVTEANGILLDLGVSSYQFDNGDRGFSYRFDAPLDMRMDRTSNGITALDVINKYDTKDLIRIIRDYGEEKWAVRIVKMIDTARKDKPIETTFQLVDIIKAAIPAAARRDGGHPAKRTFQAIRIEVNQELQVLEKALDDAIKILAPGGRLCVITFHSLEDRIVKQCFKKAENPCECPKDFPVCVCGKKSLGRNLTSKPIVSTGTELEENSRAHSAKLRIFERRE
ncbi:MAG: 16S rRNA (cytosine(1402)-N(4))-methyltransferase RsmH [Ruminococcaceae bacterium]|nr:16S rRNA (cytosine(1402)-N(4))-methyltransferase RsmH [Oscillospiraceae bacterium]